ncbi:two component transcriptional regulator, LuxR family [Chitinophaga ginsengisegetis]|uniref:Two component transcriptional regulator, LuxR family n=1 Tax=Chitinophaga ginsengisegetis TaxID=393003 RepID=A0A1T5P810_9BACT|nr:response regulator transcription factor [Chitinophaga ginsengisegetis]MDR6567829.1 DNA-binding NarL/FixJ family response regulator [Chitinophaga ginsengisegetis]MDR6647616.1 DNA-binding NarL/FixJ family response regulator [Chitinophaga ginsengisegetis]MDR6653966.1 DNA-binding NarL/FixJ family response regulator [Chitinophaga ginsengisegetis]SKD08786.1 two component transcriptional regulator, LuxR family [Chitinophaga ginsengisegetis]
MAHIKVAIADDHKIFRSGVINTLIPYENISFVFEADDGLHLLQIMETQQPDVILMDLKMPNMDGIEATIKVKEKYPDVKIIILTMYEDDNFIVHLVENGANAYLLKNAEPEEIYEAICTTFEKGFYFNDNVNLALLKKVLHKNKQQFKPTLKNEIQLNDREQEVLKLICNELTTQEISEQIFLSPRTVEGIRQKLLEKINVKNSVGLVLYAFRNGLIE